MRYVPRMMEKELLRAARNFPALLLTGPRRAGKTTLLRRVFPHASYVLLEDPDVIGRFRSDPRTFLDDLRLPAIIDEVQNLPALLNYVRTRIDAYPHRVGQWLLTGSHEAPLMKGVTESMAGRVAVSTLLPLSTQETSRVSVLRGGFPEVLARPGAAEVWFRSYLQTYLERDVRHVSEIRDLATYRRFLAMLALRVGTMLNRSDLAASLGISVPTVGQWLSILEITQQVILVPPFFENLGKRLVKSPKLFLTDTGLACHLLGITTTSELERSPFLGALVENFAASEIVKHQVHRGHRKELYYFRDRPGLEVDFIVPTKSRHLVLMEVKASRTVFPNDADSLVRLRKSMIKYPTTCLLVHRPSSTQAAFGAVRPGVKAVDLQEALSFI